MRAVSDIEWRHIGEISHFASLSDSERSTPLSDFRVEGGGDRLAQYVAKMTQ